MAEPFQPSPEPSKRFMDIVPSGQTAVSPNSRPIISPKAEPPVDPMVVATSVAKTPPEVAQNEPAAELMQREYQEVEHELPAGRVINSDELSSAQFAPVPVVGNHETKKLKRSTLDKFLIMVLAIIILLLVLDLLLDRGTIKLSGIPHTHLWHQS